jgi:hypothetical protein
MITGSCLCGAVTWSFEGDPGSATACNCTACRRYGSLWIYDWDGERIKTSGATKAYTREKPSLGFHFCPECGSMAFWRGLKPHEDGRTRIAVNVRLADDPATVADLPIEHFDGFDKWEDLPSDGRCVRDMWF